MIRAGWEAAGGEPGLTINRSRVSVPIRESYVETLPSPEVRRYIKENFEDYYFPASVDLHVHLDGQLPLAVECKAYTENTMLKKILVDFQLLTGALEPEPACVLLQLESMLGGDYEELPENPMGSSSTHTLMSHFPEVKLEIMTLLEGSRGVHEPIYEPEHFKPLQPEMVRRHCRRFAEILANHV